MDKWKLRFLLFVAYLLGYYFGSMSEKTDNWFYCGPDEKKVDSAYIGILKRY